jgi:hypothetical protein
MPIFALLLSLCISSNAQAAVKPGAQCPKLSATIVSGSYKFTCIKSGKNLVWSKGVLKAPKPPNLPKGLQPTPIVSSLPESTMDPNPSPITEEVRFAKSPEPLDVCRVPDARTSKTQVPQAIAFPVSSGSQKPGIPALGVIKVAVIPIDFPDVPGKETPSSFISPEMDQAKKWIEHFSNGKVTYSILTTNKWIRAGRDSSYFNWVHPGSQGNPLPNANSKNSRSATEITTELMKYAEKEFDYKNLNVVFFVYPKEVVNIWDAMTTFGPVSTNVGTVNVQMNATGAWLYRNHFPIWSWFIHENMHPTGIAGHAPDDGSPFGIMTNQAGASFVLDAWDQSILDWQADGSIYCISKENIKENVITLNSIDNNLLDGTKSIFIKLSSHEVLVIESRKRAYWSQGWLGYPGLPEDFSGLLVYKVDTSIDKNRAPGYGGFAVYQAISGANNGLYSGPYSPVVNLNILVKEGQTMKTSGVAITLLKSSNYDTVQISRDA